ncbi:hypothetical protein C8N35_111129 [Breoghania corrubedonensis]|uniref:Uncharacterized protein n=1 Tax=Breoghania corrubedonensis TaxID=665038 RepID=A0A2T5UYT9_9HYPH|nr:hypothetical protein [Breoghania corrubedonensis]PTW56666.1 hypothetical protein C8N35_111129 [Breoghania corrubedonensis]
MSVENDRQENGSQDPAWRRQHADRQIRQVEKSLQAVRSAALRREAGLRDVFAGIETTLSAIMETPLLRHDAHCQNLMSRIARAGTMEDFATRVADFDRHIRRIAGLSVDENAAALDYLAPSQTGLSRLCGERPAEPASNGSNHRIFHRTRLKL